MKDKLKHKIYNNGKEARFEYCPICQKENIDNPCFSVNLETGTYFCHSKGKGGILAELEDYKDIMFEGASFQSDAPQKKSDFKGILNNSISLNDEWLEYFKKRGINLEKDQLKKYFRVTRGGKKLIIPLTNGEQIIGLKYRTMDKKLTSAPGTSSDYLINWQNIKTYSHLIICEGEIDLVSFIAAGYDNVVSLPFGAGNTKCIENQLEFLNKFNEIILALDNDEAGEKGTEKIINILKKLNTTVISGDNTVISEEQKNITKIDFKEWNDANEVLQNEGAEGLKQKTVNRKKIEVNRKNFEGFPQKNEENYGKKEKNNKKSRKSEKNYGEYEGEFVIKNNHYYAWNSKGFYEELTDFTLEIIGHGQNFIHGIATIDGEEKREFKTTISELYNKENVQKHIGFFLGSSAKLVKFWYWIKSENPDKQLSLIEYYGIIENNYYHPGSKILCNKQDLKIINSDELEELTQEDIDWLEKNLIYMRKDPNQSLLGICWALGRLHKCEEGAAYPLLEVSGTTSIGKTEYIEFISRILQGTKENIKSFSTLTNHQIRSMSSCSNITNWCIDEIKLVGRHIREKSEELSSTIRAVYDNGTQSKGNTSDKMDEYKQRTPLIISGESELSDVSLKNRMVSTKLTPQNKGEFEVYQALKNTNILEKLGKKAIDNRIEKGAIKIDREKFKSTLTKIKDDRQFYNYSCVLLGLTALTNIVKIEKKIIDNFIEFLNEKSEKNEIVNNFEKLLDLVKNSGRNYDHYYTDTPTIHAAQFQMLYKVIKEEHEATNSTLELIDLNTLRKQLKECGYITVVVVQRYFNKSKAERVTYFVIKGKFSEKEYYLEGELKDYKIKNN